MPFSVSCLLSLSRREAKDGQHFHNTFGDTVAVGGHDIGWLQVSPCLEMTDRDCGAGGTITNTIRVRVRIELSGLGLGRVKIVLRLEFGLVLSVRLGLGLELGLGLRLVSGLTSGS